MLNLCYSQISLPRNEYFLLINSHAIPNLLNGSHNVEAPKSIYPSHKWSKQLKWIHTFLLKQNNRCAREIFDFNRFETEFENSNWNWIGVAWQNITWQLVTKHARTYNEIWSYQCGNTFKFRARSIDSKY